MCAKLDYQKMDALWHTLKEKTEKEEQVIITSTQRKTTTNQLEEEDLMPCWVCDKVWKRKAADSWYYFDGMLVCKSHDGANEWFSGALRLSAVKLSFLMIKSLGGKGK